MKEFLSQNGFKPWGNSYLYEMGTKKIFIGFKQKNKSHFELLIKKYPNIPIDLINLYSLFNGVSYTLQGRARNIDEAEICSLNNMFDKFKEEALLFPEDMNTSEYNNNFELQGLYLKKEDPFYRKLYTPEEFCELNNLEELKKANIIRRVKKIAPIYGYDDDIVIDLESSNKNKYQLYLLSGRSGTAQGLHPLDIDFKEFIHYFLLFGFIGHWYIAFIPKSSYTKKYLRVNNYIKELEKHFLESRIHKEKLNTIVSNFNAFK